MDKNRKSIIEAIKEERNNPKRKKLNLILTIATVVVIIITSLTILYITGFIGKEKDIPYDINLIVRGYYEDMDTLDYFMEKTEQFTTKAYKEYGMTEKEAKGFAEHSEEYMFYTLFIRIVNSEQQRLTFYGVSTNGRLPQNVWVSTVSPEGSEIGLRPRSHYDVPISILIKTEGNLSTEQVNELINTIKLSMEMSVDGKADGDNLEDVTGERFKMKVE